MRPISLVESCQQVFIPDVGTLIRIERRLPYGELVDVEYRWPSPPARIDAPAVLPPTHAFEQSLLTSECRS